MATFDPPQDVRDEAAMAVEWIAQGLAGDGFTATGRRRAQQLADGEPVSEDVVRRMAAYFARHEPDTKVEGFRYGEPGFPTPGRVAWSAWGGDPGREWADRTIARLDGAGRSRTTSEVLNMRELRSYRHVAAPELRAEGDTTTLTGYAAVFGQMSQDLGGFVEQVDPRAFDGTLARAERNVLGSFNHNLDTLLATRDSGTLDLNVDGTGLAYAMTLDMTDPDAQRVAAKVATGKVRGSSFSFAVRADEWSTTESGYPLRTLTDVVLYELGPVASPAYLQTQQDGAAVALRSFSTFLDLPFEQVAEAARAGRLAELVARDLPEVPVEEPAPEPPRETPGDEAAPARRGRRNPLSR